MPARPEQPTAARCDELLGELEELVARDGAARLLAVPVQPGPDAFPERLDTPNLRPELIPPSAIQRVLRRLAWHAAIDRTIVVHDERMGAPPTARRPETSIEVSTITQLDRHSAMLKLAASAPPQGGVGATRVAGVPAAPRRSEIVLVLALVGEDDVIGTLAHELGVAHAAIARSDPEDPYRAAAPLEIAIDPDRDLARGSHATVFLGLGVLAANAAFQQYSRAGRFNGAYSPLEYDVLRAGYAPMSELAYLLAIQALVRDPGSATAPPPAGLGGPQRDEVIAWIAALAGQGDALRNRLGIAPDARGAARPKVEVFAVDERDVEPTPDVARAGRMGFRWSGHRGGVGVVAGMVFGSVAALASLRYPGPLVLAGAGIGHVIGRRVRVTRCSLCIESVALSSATCPKCGALLRGDIERLADRLEAEEQLESASGDGSP